MNDNFFGFTDIVLILAVILINYFFFYMWHILRGKWYSISPTWEWIKDIRDLKKLSVTAPTDKIKQKCKFVLNGIYFSTGLLLFGIVFGFLIT